MNLKTMADKDNAVSGRVAAVPLDLAIGYYKTPSIFDVRAPEWFVVAFVSDDGDVLIVLHLIAVPPVCTENLIPNVAMMKPAEDRM